MNICLSIRHSGNHKDLEKTNEKIQEWNLKFLKASATFIWQIMRIRQIMICLCSAIGDPAMQPGWWCWKFPGPGAGKRPSGKGQECALHWGLPALSQLGKPHLTPHYTPGPKTQTDYFGSTWLGQQYINTSVRRWIRPARLQQAKITPKEVLQEHLPVECELFFLAEKEHGDFGKIWSVSTLQV